MRFIKNIIIQIIKTALFDYKHPRYSTFIYHISREYVNYYRGDQNANMSINGEEKFINETMKDGMMVFDVGANVGDWATRVRAIGRNIKIHCFEPDKDALDEIEVLNVVKNNTAVSDKEDVKILFHNLESSGLNSFYDMREKMNATYKNLKQVRVKTTTIDNYCERKSIRHIDLLKIDTEGHELSVMRGGGGVC
jgi:FkbM family methyltransferase